ncbi:hypothetical protein BD413DRAFT_307972 [Trametes elegans]|nr:hypothetical protein BD413DRAFT_307972 [Trametes elegans]
MAKCPANLPGTVGGQGMEEWLPRLHTPRAGQERVCTSDSCAPRSTVLTQSAPRFRMSDGCGRRGRGTGDRAQLCRDGRMAHSPRLVLHLALRPLPPSSSAIQCAQPSTPRSPTLSWKFVLHAAALPELNCPLRQFRTASDSSYHRALGRPGAVWSPIRVRPSF